MTLTVPRTDEHAPKAIQFLVLGSAGETGAFQAQAQALHNIRDLVFRNLGSDAKFDDGSERLYLQRRVFTRVSSRDARHILRLNLLTGQTGGTSSL